MLRTKVAILVVFSLLGVGLVATTTVASATTTAPQLSAAALAPCDDQNNPACCPDNDPDCHVWGDDPGDPPGGGGNNPGGPRVCRWEGQTVPCSDPVLGIFIGDGCYVKKIEPPPAEGPPMGHEGATHGAWYVKSCYWLSTEVVTQLYWWMDNVPVTPPSPEELARRALASIRLEPAAVGFAPSPGGAGLVGLPVWMWTEVNPNTWGPITASASDSGLTVTITARAQQIVWNMGNADSVTCANPGTKYEASYGRQASPTCGYTYKTSSRDQPGGRYGITATTTWQVDWAGGGESGVITTTRTTNVSVRIDELQVVVG